LLQSAADAELYLIGTAALRNTPQSSPEQVARVAHVFFAQLGRQPSAAEAAAVAHALPPPALRALSARRLAQVLQAVAAWPPALQPADADWWVAAADSVAAFASAEAAAGGGSGGGGDSSDDGDRDVDNAGLLLGAAARHSPRRAALARAEERLWRCLAQRVRGADVQALAGMLRRLYRWVAFSTVSRAPCFVICISSSAST
jgi:hypothetical protein